MRFGKLLFVVAAGSLMVFPAVAAAQSSFAGQVTDNTGGVLPGVTVEASSPALIEGSRIAITDGAGLYNIIDLRPGTYAISFTLPGFGTQIRDQLELPADVPLTIDVAMSVGGIEETVTVSGEAPVVDVQQVQRVEVLTREVQEAIPTGRSMWSYALLIPGVKVHKPDVGGTSGAQQSTMTGRGLDGRHTTVQMDGIMNNTLIDDGQFQAYLNPMLSAETSYTTTGINAETQTGGLRINMIPAEGGNNFSGQFFGGGTPSQLTSKNWNHRMGAIGIQEDGLPEIVRIYDFNAAVGGPLFRDRLWFFSTARRNVHRQRHRQQLPARRLARHRRQQHHQRGDPPDVADGRQQQAVGHVRQGPQAPLPPAHSRAGRGDRRRLVDLAPLRHRAGQVDVDHQQPHAGRVRLLDRLRGLGSGQPTDGSGRPERRVRADRA